MFSGSVCKDWSQVELKVGIVVTAQDFSVAAKYFSLTVVEDLKHIEMSNKHHVLGEVLVYWYISVKICVNIFIVIKLYCYNLLISPSRNLNCVD